MPDTVSAFNDDDWEAFNSSYAVYLPQTASALDDLSPADFSPELVLFDEFVSSLLVEPDAELQDTELIRSVGETDPPTVITPPLGLIYRTTDGLWCSLLLRAGASC